MTAITAILLASLAAQAGVGPRQPSVVQAPPDIGQRGPDAPFALAIAVTRVRADGTQSGSAGDRSVDPFQSYVWSNTGLCTLAAANDEPASPPFVGWHFTGRILQAVGDDGYLVEIDWQRRWDGSRPATDPSGFLQVVMHPGDRLPLDVVEPASPGACDVKELRLEASMVPSTRVSERSVAVMNGPVVLQSPRAGGRGGGRGSITGGAGGGRPIDPSRRYDAELWVVQTLSDGTERAQRQTLAFGGAARDFAFPPIHVTVGQAPIDVTITGVVRLTSSAAPGEGLLVVITRQLTDANGDSLGWGGASKTIAIPPAGEVVSFELPAQLSTRVTLRDQTISVRLRLK